MMKPRFAFALLGVISMAVGAVAAEPFRSAASLNLMVVMDGLRPDYVTPDVMPNLHVFGKRGLVFKRHHSVFPTVTRVNAASFSTGCYPAKHGLLGNSVYFPKLNKTHGLDTSEIKNLRDIDESTGGRLLTAPTMGEILQANGKKLLAVSAGSSGQGFLLNSKVAGGMILHNDYTLPESFQPHVLEVLGPPPEDSTPNEKKDIRAVDAFLKIGLDEQHPNVAIVWFTDPDHTAHKAGIGEPQTVLALRQVDEQFGRLLAGIEARGLKDKVNIFVTSDHGFSTHTGPANIKDLLIKNNLKERGDSDDIVVVEGAIYVKDHDKEKIQKIVELLQATDWVGAIFTRQAVLGHPEGIIAGTFSLTIAHANHERKADILVSANWNDEKSATGFPGKTTQAGTAGHGTSSPYDIHNTLIAGGPDLKAGREIDVPTGNIDLAPTLLYLSGIEPAGMDGRVLREALKAGPDPKSVTVQERRFEVHAQNGGNDYQIELFESGVDVTDYLDYTKVTRKKVNP